MWMMRLEEAQEDVSVGEERHLHATRAVKTISAERLLRKQRR
jgi:hypothetical protein